MASTRCMTKVTKRRKTLAQRSQAASQSRQVVMKAKTKQSLRTVRLSASAKQAALRQLPKVLKKKCRSSDSHVLSRPTASHGYLLRSRSVQETPHISQLHSSLSASSVAVQDDTDRLKSLSSSHDSGIESATNTSDSEDSTASASESSEVSGLVSFPSSPSSLPLERTSLLLHNNANPTSSSSSPIHQVTIDLSVTSSTHGRITKTLVHVEAGDSCHTASDSTFAVLGHNLLHYGECIPDFLQDIDDVIKADVPESCSSSMDSSAGGASSSDTSCNGSTESHSSITDISLCHERLEDSICGMDIVVVDQIDRYMYSASAGELEFVMEIFRGAHHSSPLIRIPAVLPPKTRSCPTYTLILDLDETLVHCFTNEPPAKFDHSFSVEVPDGNGGEPTELAVYARLRPFVKEFLERMARKFEVVVFTASMKNYSSKMLDLLDPQGIYFKHRFYRDHCVPVGCSFVKDLSIFTRDLSKLIIVDNQIASFAFQIDNGIPIRSWIGDDDDQELMLLAPFLETIADHADLDVRHFIREKLQVPSQLHTHVQTYYPQTMEPSPVTVITTTTTQS